MHTIRLIGLIINSNKTINSIVICQNKELLKL